ncbi:M20 family metallopeptidase [Saccharibacillus sp. CPCC 101409]|uniref:M20 family metallopeptidase n=1 Tax=Saccharibacillus sp. CPCC 101409 TaxID=3058041 RepID=UPI002673F588|nr:M20 family metallopeptidase [Saccharibacillus sp. CPCC 101409]MDO3408283.1 M20 family metallopeptidase [Saccharibacillus sp. CPCC 101409]
MLELIGQLVDIDSGTFDKEGVDRVGGLLAEEYRKLGFKVEAQRREERGDNLLITHPYGRKADILAIAHMDTVFPKGTASKRPFSRDERKAYGPGVMDMKASQITTLYALKYLIASGSPAYRDVRLVLNTDEEVGSVHSRQLIEEQARQSRYALIVEPSDDEGTLVTGRRGGGKYYLSVAGIAAHSGAEPEKGRSAIAELAHKILKLHALTDAEAGIHVNVGVISGGTSSNTIAPHAQANIDVRMETAEQAAELDRRVREICSSVDIEGTSLELTGGITRPPMIPTQASERLLGIVQEESLKLGERIVDKKVGSGSDGNLTASVGIPTIDGLGPRGGSAHSADEYLLLDSLIPRTKLLAAVIERLSGERE